MTWAWFTKDEFACKCGKCENKMDDDFISKLDELRSRLKFPLKVSSGYRCPEHNQKVSSTGPNGPHTTGRAVDLLVEGDRAYQVVWMACRLFFTGIGVRQHGGGRFIHLDDLAAPQHPRPRIWSYP